MRQFTVIAVCLVLMMLTSAVYAEMVQGEVTQIQHPTLNINGEGSVEVAPDTVRVTASVVTEGASVEVARERNAQIITKSMDAVKALNIKDIATKTLNYTMERVTQNTSAYFNFDAEKLDIPWNISNMELSEKRIHINWPITLGYRASNSLTVRVQGGTPDELSDAASKIIDALMASGTNQILSVEYTLEKDDGAARSQALEKAVKNAQSTADVVAAAAGKKIVGIQRISPSYSYPRYAQNTMMQRASFEYSGSDGSGGTPTSVTAGMVTVTANVSISYNLDYNEGDTKMVGEAEKKPDEDAKDKEEEKKPEAKW